MSVKTGLEYVGCIDPWTDEERLSDEEIVRCRDCKHCRERDMRAYAGDADQMVCYHFSMNDRCGWLVEPDGFCSWGERRADG